MLVQLADRRTVGVLQRATVGLRREGEQLVVGAFRLESFRSEHGDLFGAADRLGHRALDDDLADADVRQLAFAEDVGAADAGGADRRRELLLVALVDRDDRGARFVGPVREDEARGLAGFEPDAELEAGRGVVGHHAAGEQRFDGLRIVDVALGDVTGHDAEHERFREVDAEDGGIVMGVAVQGRRFDLDVVEAGDRHTLSEILDVSVAALTGVGVRLFVKVEVAEVEGALVRARQFFVLDEVLVEAPGLRRGGGLAEAGLDEAVGGLEILVDQEAGGHQRLADRVEVTRGLFLGEVGGQAEGVDAASEQGGEGILVLAVGEPTQDRA